MARTNSRHAAARRCRLSTGFATRPAASWARSRTPGGSEEKSAAPRSRRSAFGSYPSRRPEILARLARSLTRPRWCPAGEPTVDRGRQCVCVGASPIAPASRRAMAGWRFDVRVDGSFVIALGSLHASGAEFREAGDWNEPREALPRFWPGWLQRPTRRAGRPDAAHDVRGRPDRTFGAVKRGRRRQEPLARTAADIADPVAHRDARAAANELGGNG